MTCFFHAVWEGDHLEQYRVYDRHYFDYVDSELIREYSIDTDYLSNNLVYKIIKNTKAGYVIKDNIKLSEPTFDKNELPTLIRDII